MAQKKGKTTRKTATRGTGNGLKPISIASKVRSKGQILSSLSEATGLPRKQVATIFMGMSSMIEKDLGKKGPGTFTVPGLLKIKVVHKPATKARKGINPFTGQETMFKAKPARNVVKIRPLKALKEMVN